MKFKNLFKKEKGREKRLEDILDTAFHLEILLFVVAVVQVIVLLMNSAPINLYTGTVFLRSYSNTFMYVYLGIYLPIWYSYNSVKVQFNLIMKQFKILTIILFVVCIGKTLLAGFSVYQWFMLGKTSCIYYLGEAIAWAAIGTYFMIYLKHHKVLSAEEQEAEFDSRQSRMDDKIDAALRRSSNSDAE